MSGLDSLYGGVYRGKSVFVTGHTGFKGSWLTLFLQALGARVTGYSLAPDTDPSVFLKARVAEGISHHEADVRDAARLASVMASAKPDMVFHLAAQPLVRKSYAELRETFETNVMGAVNVFEAVRKTPSVRAVVNVTSDKCYENREWIHPYRESDPMGGHDPYSASKGAVEIVASSYRRSFFSASGAAALASGRAGNVIGGGDWTADRIIPDCVRALSSGRAVEVRNPAAVRPWQHVLEPLSGYLLLGAKLWAEGQSVDYGWNFGPLSHENIPVGEVVRRAVAAWGGGAWNAQSEEARKKNPHEAGLLRLDCTKAVALLGWSPVFRTHDAIDRTVSWYRDYYKVPGFDARERILKEIGEYAAEARRMGQSWACAPEKEGAACR